MIRCVRTAAGALGLAAALSAATSALAQGAPPQEDGGAPQEPAAEPTPPPAEAGAGEDAEAEPDTETPIAEPGDASPEALDASATSEPVDGAASDPRSDEPAADEPPPTQTTAELLEEDGFALGSGDGAGLPALSVEEEPETEEVDTGPWGQGTIVPGLGIGFGFGADSTVLSFSVGASYYVIDGLAVGLSLGDTIFFYSDELDEAYPGFSDQIPTNIFSITPTVQYVFYRHESVSPYVFAGVGPVFYNNDGGVVGQWIAGPGIFISLGGPVALDLGVSFSSIFPEDDWEEAFSYEGQRVVECSITDSLCSFEISPRIGIVLSF